jgi:hypothetical protein
MTTLVEQLHNETANEYLIEALEIRFENIPQS